jgi:hypothetical protein
MQVVVAGVHVLSPGQKVTIYKEKEAVIPDERAKAAINTIATSVQMPTPAPAAK